MQQQRAAGLSQNQKLAAGAAALGLGYWMYSRRQVLRPGRQREQRASPAEAAAAVWCLPVRRRRRRRRASAPAAAEGRTSLHSNIRATNLTIYSLLAPSCLSAKPRTWGMPPAGRVLPPGAPSRRPARR